MADIGAVTKVFHWPPSEIESLTLRELRDYADLARAAEDEALNRAAALLGLTS